CGSQFRLAPPGTSAQEFLGEFSKTELPPKPLDLEHIAHKAFWGLHAWRNAGLILGLRMPGLDDVLPRYWEQMEGVPDPFKRMCANPQTLGAVLDGLRPRASAIDTALAGKQGPGPADYVKALLTARQKLAPFLDFGSSVELVRAPVPAAAGWRFTSTKGMALTAVNVSDAPRVVTFPNAKGTWVDGVSGDVLAAQNNTLAVQVPPHRVRLLSPGAK
ncbi:MAG TPA: hypothetical protein VKU44_12210, partial [Terriglobia bacterium]|nr:hypothetical protein [Terriglobia bacterium]